MNLPNNPIYPPTPPRRLSCTQAFVLNQQLASYMWWGVAINILAMVLVSATNFIEPQDAQPDGANNPALGAFFILLSCVVQASRA